MKRVLFLPMVLVCLALTNAYAKKITVKTNSELKAANGKALAGDTIELQNGDWLNCAMELTCSGTAANPIVFKAQEAGKVNITGKSYLHISGSYIVVEGLTFANGNAPQGSVWEFRNSKQVANNCRITNCCIRDFNNPKRLDENYWVGFFGKNNRVDHCTFYNKKNLGVLMAVMLDDDRSRLNSHSIDNNNFSVRIPLGSNAGEIIRVGVSQHCTFYSNTVIKDNIFDNCDGEAEVISIKSCGNIVRNNVFKECQGSVVLRHGNNNTVEANIFLGNGKEGTGGVRIINEGNWVVNNLFYECRGVNFRSPLAVMNGVFNSPPFRYLPVRDAVVANNTYINCTPFSLCEGSDAERSVPPRNVYFFNNVFLNNKDTVLYYVFDKTDSIYFRNNIVKAATKQKLLPGFERKEITLAGIKASSLPAANGKGILPDSIAALASSRLAYGFAKTAGFARWNEYNKVVKDEYVGKGFKQKEIGKWSAYPPTSFTADINCANAEDVYKAFETKNKSVINITLTGSEYHFSKPVIIAYPSVTISGDASRTINISSVAMPFVFMVQGNATASFQNLNINAAGVKATHFIVSDTSGSSNHFGLTVDHVTVQGLQATSFFNASRSSVADMIRINNSSFTNNNANLFDLKEETDNKGYYNAEKMSISYCIFNNNKGRILDLYRGGTDESTMGPDLTFSNNKITGCNNDSALVKLFGVQRSLFNDNLFTASNKGNTSILYQDNVRALHRQINNRFVNSGAIKENQFVVNK